MAMSEFGGKTTTAARAEPRPILTPLETDVALRRDVL